MAEDIAVLGIKVLSDDIVKATKRLDKLEKESKSTEKQNKKTTASFKGMGAAIGGLGLGLAFKNIISLAIEQERVVKQVDAAIKSTGGAAGFTTEELQKMAAGFQDVTNYGDESILSMQSVLLTFTNLKDDVFPATTEAVLNLSERMGTDLQSSAIQLGKALNDPIKNLSALSRAGIQFTDDQKDVIKGLWETGQQAEAQRIILAELEVQFGGSAVAARDTFGGALKSLGNAFGDLLEGDGGNLNDAKGAIEELTLIMQDEGTKAAFGSIVTLVVGITTALATMIGKLSSGGKHLGEFLANALAEETTSDRVDDINERLKVLAGVMSQTINAPQGTRMAKQFAKAREDVIRLTAELNELGGGVTFVGEVTDGGDVAGRADPVLTKQIELDLIAEKEMDAALDRAVREQEEMERLSDYNDQKLAVQMDYYDRLYNLEAGSQEAALAFTESLRMSDTKGALQNGALMLANAAKTNKAAFELQKGSALANAVVTLPSAVMKSFDNGGGYPFGLIPAGLMLKAGTDQINSIKNSSFGGGGGAPSISGGGSTSPSSPVASGLPAGTTALPDRGEEPRAGVTNIALVGQDKTFTGEQIDAIFEEISDALERGDRVLFSSDSRQALELSA